MTKPHNEEYASPRCEVLTLQMQGIIANSPPMMTIFLTDDGTLSSPVITDHDW